jgi:hypothetical protein
MPDTLLSSLSSTLKLTTREEIARLLGESEPAVSRGFEFATSAVFDGLHRQTGQSDVMRQVIELASKAPADIGAALNTGQLGNANSPLILSGKKFLSSVLGQAAELVKLGVAGDRLLAKGYGEEHPVGDNATEAGRAQNRRISMLVTQKS